MLFEMAIFDLGDQVITVSGTVWQGKVSYSDVTERLRFETTVPYAGQQGDDMDWVMDRVTSIGWDELGLKSVSASGSQLGFYFYPDQNQFRVVFSGQSPAHEYGYWKTGLFGG